MKCFPLKFANKSCCEFRCFYGSFLSHKSLPLPSYGLLLYVLSNKFNVFYNNPLT